MTDEFVSEYETLSLPKPRSVFALLTYDSVWTVAYVLRQFLDVTTNQHDGSRGRGDSNSSFKAGTHLASFSYHTGAVMRAAFTSAMENANFIGVSVCKSVFSIISLLTLLRLLHNLHSAIIIVRCARKHEIIETNIIITKFTRTI